MVKEIGVNEEETMTENNNLLKKAKRDLSTPYTCFASDSKDWVDYALYKLVSEDQELCALRWGSEKRKLTKSETNRFNRTVLGRIEKTLEKFRSGKLTIVGSYTATMPAGPVPPAPDVKPSEESPTKERRKRRDLTNAYTCFSGDSKETVDFALSLLTQEERDVLDIRWGENRRPFASVKERNKFFQVVLPKLEKNVIDIREGRITISVDTKNKLPEETPSSTTLQSKLVDEQDDIFVSMPTLSTEFTKEDYEALRAYISRPEYQDAIKTLPLEECIIAALSLTMIGNKPVSFATLAELFGVKEKEVEEIAKKGLFALKEKFDTHVDMVARAQVKEIGGIK